MTIQSLRNAYTDGLYRWRKRSLENDLMKAGIRAERLYADYRELLATKGIVIASKYPVTYQFKLTLVK